MKKAIVFVLLICSSILGYSQDGKGGTTQFDQVLLQKGTLIVKEFVPFGKFNQIDGEIAILTNMNANLKVYALRLTVAYYKSQYDNGETTGVLDAKEIVSAINSLDFMIKKNKEIQNTAPYTEIIYRGNGEPEFGFYVSGSLRKLFFKVSSKYTCYFEISQLDILKKFLEDAKNKIVELGGSTD